MASSPSSRTRGKRSIGFFADLNNVTVADICRELKARRCTVDGGRFFEVERVISSRQGQQGSLWFRYYKHPKPDRNVILNEVSRLRVAIAASLKASKQRKQVTMEFREDVFQHFFGKKGVINGQWKLLAQEEFSPSFFLLIGIVYLTFMGREQKFCSQWR